MLVVNGQFTDDIGYRAMQDFLALPEPPTAVLAGFDDERARVMRAVRSAGLQLGRDMSLIAHDDVFQYINARQYGADRVDHPLLDAGGRRPDRRHLLQMLAGRDVAKPSRDLAGGAGAARIHLPASNG